MYLEANNIKIEDVMAELDKRKMSYDEKYFCKNIKGTIVKKFTKMIMFCHFMILTLKKKFMH